MVKVNDQSQRSVNGQRWSIVRSTALTVQSTARSNGSDSLVNALMARSTTMMAWSNSF
ncbi:hypothetical protein PanWU01x14_067240, partial [Parasponia andersonii]